MIHTAPLNRNSNSGSSDQQNCLLLIYICNLHFVKNTPILYATLVFVVPYLGNYYHMTTTESVAKSRVTNLSRIVPVSGWQGACSLFSLSAFPCVVPSFFLTSTTHFAREEEESFTMRFSKLVAFAALGPLAYVPVASAWGAVGMFLSYFCEILGLTLFV